jgi:hypothetical protein
MYFPFKYFIQHKKMQTINKNRCILHSKAALFKLVVVIHHWVKIRSSLGCHRHSLCPCLWVLCIYYHNFYLLESFGFSTKDKSYCTHWGQWPVFQELPRLWGQLLLLELNCYTCAYSDTGHHLCEAQTAGLPCLIWEFGFLTFTRLKMKERSKLSCAPDTHIALSMSTADWTGSHTHHMK